MKREKPFIYYRSKELKALIDKLMTDFNYKRQNRFIEDVLTNQTFEIRNVKPRFQSHHFNSYKSNLNRVEQFYKEQNQYSSAQQNEHQVNDFRDIHSLIEAMHINNIENVKVSDYAKHRHTENGNVGLDINSAQFFDCYIRILETSLYLFDSLIAQPKLIELTTEHSYMKELQKRLKKLPDVNNQELSYRERGITKALVTSSHCETLRNLAEQFKQASNEEIQQHNSENKHINQALLNTINELNKIDESSNAQSCIKQIYEMMSKINNVNQINSRTNTDFVISKLKEIRILAYVEAQDAAEDIERFIDNMSKLNNVVKEFHSLALKTNAEDKALLLQAKKVKYMLRLVAMRNYQITSKYETK